VASGLEKFGPLTLPIMGMLLFSTRTRLVGDTRTSVSPYRCGNYFLTCYYPVQWEEYARSIHSFLSGFGTGVDVDFKSRNLVGIGHSMGAVCL
jgi:hypothetical protein